MTLYGDIWRLPGPSGYVREIARMASRGQHVLAIVPHFIGSDPEYSDSLAVAILNELDSQHRVYPSESNGGLVSALGVAMTDDFDDAPSTVPGLISHPDVVGGTFLCNASDLDREHRAELPSFLDRLSNESRPVATHDRGTLIFVLGRDLINQDPTSVAMVPIWYWDRVTRWDTAALIAGRHPELPSGVVGEVRLEVITEIARWDLETADELAQDWASDSFRLREWVSGRSLPTPPATPPRKAPLAEPPASHLESWDSGTVDSWHGSPEVSPLHVENRSDLLDRLTWRAQARVLLPWLEIRRVRVEQLVRERLGAKQMANAVVDYAPRFPGVEIDPTLIEIGTLGRIINARLGRSEDRLKQTTRLLTSARNRLAHLTALSDDDLVELVKQSAWLS